ncbi:MAG: phosphate ABC transporter permease subunit PstC [Dehalococcoidia bacterium]|nr:phosphate ABC transporter permease subunit PstC [Dehalococcoidia bacterium]
MSRLIGRRWADLAATRLMFVATVFVASVAVFIGIGLLLKSWPILEARPLSELLFSSVWCPSRGEFGFYPFIMGTLWVTGLAGIIALPLSLLSALYLAEYAPNKVRALVKPALDLLAGIPSVVYGIWGILALSLGGISIGFNVLAGGIVLAIMVIPVVTSVSEEVFRTVPRDIKEASLAVGATRWETAKHVVMRASLPGVAAAVVLGFSRAFGETMAVLMVVGNVARAPSSVMDPAYPLTALIANNYGEMMSVPLYDSALLLAALVLLVMVLVFNVAARLALARVQRRWA